MSYKKHTWEKGDKITADRLNNIEEGINNANVSNEKYTINFNKGTELQTILSWVMPANKFNEDLTVVTYLDDTPLKYVGTEIDNLYCNGKPLTQKSSEEPTVYYYNCIFEPGTYYPENLDEPAFIVAFMENNENDLTPGYHLWYTNTYVNMVGQTFTLSKEGPSDTVIVADKSIDNIVQAYNNGKDICGKLNGIYNYHDYSFADFKIFSMYPDYNPNTIVLQALCPESNNNEPILVTLNGHKYQNNDSWILHTQELETKNTVFHYVVKKVSDALVVDEDELDANNNFRAIIFNTNHGYQRMASIQCDFDINDHTQLFYPISQLIPAVGNEKAQFKASGLFYDKPNNEWKIGVLTIINEPVSVDSDKSQCTFELIDL